MCLESKSQVYVRDLRKPILHQKKRLMYPKNYDQIVKNGSILVDTNSEGGKYLKLLYGKKDKDGMQNSYTLDYISEDVCHSKAYYTIHHLLNYESEGLKLHKSYYEPFGFSSVEIRNYLPIFDLKKTEDPNNPYQIVNTLYLAKKGCSVDDESGEVEDNTRKDKGLNGKQLFESKYEKLDPKFFVIKDEHGKVEIDKTIACLPITLMARLFICIRILLFFLPMKLGECLLHTKNSVAKIFGHILFTPFVPLKFFLDVTAVLVEIPVLIFVANEKKYGDSYCTLWKHQFMQCFHELESDCSVIKTGDRLAVPDYDEYVLIGTWNELNVRSKLTKHCLP